MKISLFFRCPGIFYSIEQVFSTVSAGLSLRADVSKVSMPFYRPTFLNILRNLWFTFHHASAINHITGDIHYCAMALPVKGLVLTIHDTVLIDNTCGLRKWLFKLIWYQLPIRRAQCVTCISQKTARKIVEYFPWAEKKICIVHNPIAPSFKFVQREFNQRYPTILFVGTRENKNLYRAIKAIAEIPCKLRIIGELTNEISKSLSEYNIDYSSIQNLTEEEVVTEYKNCDLVLFPSTYEGFGMPIIEAQATGRIVITSNIEPMIEVANGSAILVDPYNIKDIRRGIVEGINDSDERNKLIQLGKKNCARFSVDAICSQYIDIYNRICCCDSIK